jgi:hypothetical protein
VLGVRRCQAPYPAIGRGLVEAGLISEPDDACFVLVDELVELGRGTIIADLNERIERRREPSTTLERYRLPDNWAGEPVVEEVSVGEQREASMGLGVGAGQGPVTGTARIVPSAEAGLARDIEQGDILIARTPTRPGRRSSSSPAHRRGDGGCAVARRHGRARARHPSCRDGQGRHRADRRRRHGHR